MNYSKVTFIVLCVALTLFVNLALIIGISSDKDTVSDDVTLSECSSYLPSISDQLEDPIIPELSVFILNGFNPEYYIASAGLPGDGTTCLEFRTHGKGFSKTTVYYSKETGYSMFSDELGPEIDLKDLTKLDITAWLVTIGIL